MRLPAAAVLLVPCLALSVQDNKPASPAPKPLAVFAPLVGRDWIADFPGGKARDTQRFEWVYGDKFIRNVHQVRTTDGKTVYEGETIYAADARSSAFVWWYWNSTGGYVTGTVTPGPGGKLSIEGENHGAKSQLDRVRQVITIGDGTWTVEPAQEKDGKWIEQPVRTYRPAE